MANQRQNENAKRGRKAATILNARKTPARLMIFQKLQNYYSFLIQDGYS